MAHSSSLSRRDFARRVAAASAGALVLGSSAGQLAAAEKSAPASGAARGIWKIIRNGKVLESPLGMPADETWRYLLVVPFQIGPTTAAAWCNLKMSGAPGQDYEGGTDLIVFDRIGGLRAENAIPVSRQHRQPNPHNNGRMAVMAKYPGNVGFVPLGAKLPDGRPHPHAGTGFAMVSTAAWPIDKTEGYVAYPDRLGLTAYWGEKRYRTLEIYQLSFDGTTLKVGPKEVIEAGAMDPGYRFDAGGMGIAIADGEDLIDGLKMTKKGGKASSSGVFRWRRVNGAWRPLSYEPVTPEDNSLEPSVVRDLDGSLLLAARGPRSMGPPLRVWRQAAPGQPWEKRIHIDGMLPSTPVGINTAVDGTPFIAGNLYQPEFRLPAGLNSDGGISRLEPVGWRGERSTICVWPLNAARNGLEAEFIARDPRVEFGLPPHGTVWALDHPQAAPVRLADGQWHTLMGYRILEWKENTHFIPPGPHTGAYLDEIVSFGPPVEHWKF